MNLQDAIDLVHDIREHYPQLIVHLAQFEHERKTQATIWISREFTAHWYDENTAHVCSLADIASCIKAANVFHGLTKNPKYLETGSLVRVLYRHHSGKIGTMVHTPYTEELDDWYAVKFPDDGYLHYFDSSELEVLS